MFIFVGGIQRNCAHGPLIYGCTWGSGANSNNRELIRTWEMCLRVYACPDPLSDFRNAPQKALGAFSISGDYREDGMPR